MDPFHLIFLVFAVAVGALRGYFQRQTRGNRPVKRDASIRDRALLLFAMAAMMPIPLLHIFTSIFAPFNFMLPLAASWLGVAALVASLWLFWRSHADLGVNWSPYLAIQQSHTLVERGVYRRIRHPLYASLFVAGVGQLLTLQNWVGGGSILFAAILFYFFRIPQEEQLMQAEFGEAYAIYMQRTGRIFPRL